MSLIYPLTLKRRVLVAEAISPGKRSQKEDIFVHHRFYGSYHRSENMVVHSLAETEECPTCQKQEELRQKQIVAQQREREQVKKVKNAVRFPFGPVPCNDRGEIVVGFATVSIDVIRKLEAAIKELEPAD